MTFERKKNANIQCGATFARLRPNVSTTPIMAIGCRQCLPLSVVQLKGKHCRKPHCRNGLYKLSRMLKTSRLMSVFTRYPFSPPKKFECFGKNSGDKIQYNKY
jgi:hypothetical protein